jgi:uncharacterized membrane protein YbhN (UPF0104 family)
MREMKEITASSVQLMDIRRRFLHWVLRILPVIVAVALLALLLRSSSLEKFIDLWNHFNTVYLATGMALIVATITCGSIALLLLFELNGRTALWARFTVDYFHVQALCQLTPAQAGEMALPYIAGRGRFAPGEIAASLVIQRMVSLGIVVVVALAGAGRWTQTWILWGGGGLVLLSCLAGIGMIRNGTIRTWLNNFVNRRFGPILFGFYDTWTGIFRERRGRLLLHVILMICRFVIAVGAGFFIFRSVGVVVPFWDYAALTAWTTLALLIPISVNGVGVTEGIFVAALSAYGNGTEQVLAASLAGRTLSILILLAGSAAYWFLRRREHHATMLT